MEVTRILLRKNALNSKAGYNRSGVARHTIWEEDMSRRLTGQGSEAANRMEKNKNLEMAKKAKSKKRDRDEENLTRIRINKKIRK